MLVAVDDMEDDKKISTGEVFAAGDRQWRSGGLLTCGTWCT
jgi:hypothetical protein